MKLFPAATLALCIATPALAGATTIDFETVTSFASIGAYYNGGADSTGRVGPALGVSFSGGALGLMNDPAPFAPYFSHAPSPLGVMAPVEADSTLNVASGFADAFSFYYSASSAVSNGVQVWSGLNGTGTVLAAFSLIANAQNGGCSDSAYCRFDQLYGTFAGTARSVTFGNATNVAAFDNLSITPVPEPTTVLLMAMGLAGLALVRRRF